MFKSVWRLHRVAEGVQRISCADIQIAAGDSRRGSNFFTQIVCRQDFPLCACFQHSHLSARANHEDFAISRDGRGIVLLERIVVSQTFVLLRKTHPSQQLFEARVVAQRVKARFNLEKPNCVLPVFYRLIQFGERFVLLAELGEEYRGH